MASAPTVSATDAPVPPGDATALAEQLASLFDRLVSRPLPGHWLAFVDQLEAAGLEAAPPPVAAEG